MNDAEGKTSLGEDLCRLGKAYEFGFGAPKDYALARNCYRQAAQGCPHAQFNLGEAYRFGEGVKEDIDEAMKWYRLVGDKGFNNAKLKFH